MDTEHKRDPLFLQLWVRWWNIVTASIRLVAADRSQKAFMPSNWNTSVFLMTIRLRVLWWGSIFPRQGQCWLFLQRHEFYFRERSNGMEKKQVPRKLARNMNNKLKGEMGSVLSSVQRQNGKLLWRNTVPDCPSRVSVPIAQVWFISILELNTLCVHPIQMFLCFGANQGK